MKLNLNNELIKFVLRKAALKPVLVCGLVFGAVGWAGAQPEKYSERMAETAMKLWPDSFSLGKPGTPAKWSYDLGVILKGVEAVWKGSGDARWFAYIQQQMDHYVQDDGTIKAYKREDYNIDFINNGKLLLLLYQVTGKAKYYNAASLLRDQLRTHPRTSEGGFWHKKIYPHQMWLDGLYMGQPFFAEYAKLFNERDAFDDITNQFVLMERHSRDDETGLLYHGWDESREQAWADKATGRSPNFWGRSLGWFGMALVDAIEHFPEDHPGVDSLAGILQRFAKAVIAFQDKRSGVWYDVVDMAHRPENYLEASASCMLVYTLAKGVRLGYLPEGYIKQAQKGYSGILKTFISGRDDGGINLERTVAVSGLGGSGRYRDGSFAYYMSEPVIQNDPKGMGAFIKCAAEMELLPTLGRAKGKTVVLDYYYNNEYRVDVTGRQVRYHYVWEDQSNSGYSFLGHLFNRYGVRTASLETKPGVATLGNADVYIIVDPDTEKETNSPNFLERPEIDVITEWVRQGGVLVLLGNDAGNAEFTHFNQLAGRFGIRFNEDNALSVKNDHFPEGAVQLKKGNSVFKKPYRLFLKEVSTLELTPPARSLVQKEGKHLMATAKYGKGTVFALGDPWIYNEYIDGRKLPPDFENYEAADAWVQWLLAKARRK
ncbi:glycoside hydrolase family 88 protein [Parapedobacter sp. ISTM3]|uniref:glycoside hydrolase family 88 protein n=1 Tax=Parapedobacter sp. ISTM3 TaxID=2800130 RepID=UPI0019050AA7|nr:glycoside hydrolase family 88 protein [Parapedobacter sp. ISTM3]MBK1438938.1 glycoside hydrolase family 88 protein [Parapedobacter sp. ISTM3]